MTARPSYIDYSPLPLVTRRHWPAQGDHQRFDLYRAGWRTGTYKTRAGIDRAVERIRSERLRGLDETAAAHPDPTEVIRHEDGRLFDVFARRVRNQTESLILIRLQGETDTDPWWTVADDFTKATP
ncbi:hypothetical protein [Streptomyces sp. NPDC001787]|uniref:hypothetical protein n=1 Tax=Streptomyces sp. NPDC001787 TaxID=3154523 RepID=UPI0033254C5F